MFQLPEANSERECQGMCPPWFVAACCSELPVFLFYDFLQSSYLFCLFLIVSEVLLRYNVSEISAGRNTVPSIQYTCHRGAMTSEKPPSLGRLPKGGHAHSREKPPWLVMPLSN